MAISGKIDFLFRLFLIAVGKEAISPRQAAQLDLIRRSTGGGHMADLIRCFLHGPAEGALQQTIGQRK